MNIHMQKEAMLEREVTYTLEMNGKFLIVEHVPARVCTETGEQLFSPETVGRLQKTVWSKKDPAALLKHLSLILPAS